MPKLLNFLSRAYPYLFLALVICGPVLLLPHTVPVFMFLAVVDCALTILFGGIYIVCLTLHLTVPAFFRQASADAAVQIVGPTRAQKLQFYLHQAARVASTALMVLTAHPYFASVALLGHALTALFRRLIAKAHEAKA